MNKLKALALLSRNRCFLESEIIKINEERNSLDLHMKFNKTIQVLCYEERVSFIKLLIEKLDATGDSSAKDEVEKMIRSLTKQLATLSKNALVNQQHQNIMIQALAETIDVFELIMEVFNE